MTQGKKPQATVSLRIEVNFTARFIELAEALLQQVWIEEGRKSDSRLPVFHGRIHLEIEMVGPDRHYIHFSVVESILEFSLSVPLEAVSLHQFPVQGHY